MKTHVVTFYGAGRILATPYWRMAPHSHKDHEIIVMMRGKMNLRTPCGELVARRGDILHYRPGLVHEEWSDPRQPFQSCFVAFKAGDGPLEFPLCLHDEGGRVRQIIRWVEEDTAALRAPELRATLVESIIHEMRRLSGTPLDPWLETVRDFIRHNLSHRLTLDDLARSGKMSRFAFVRKFKRLGGRTPMQELRAMRLNHAHTLLLTTNLPVKAIAPEVGIGDEYQLSKLFRARFNLSPRGMRIRNRPGRKPRL